MQGLEHDSPFMVPAGLGAEAAGWTGRGAPLEYFFEAASRQLRWLPDLIHNGLGVREIGAHSFVPGVFRVRLAGEAVESIVPALPA